MSFTANQATKVQKIPQSPICSFFYLVRILANVVANDMHCLLISTPFLKNENNLLSL